jgi:transcriptional regulator with PAS, ATPase and Fis domain
MITASAEMRAFFQTVRRVAATDVSVLIRGETGTGKEMVARAIHDLSARHDQPFLAVNCATFRLELLASELFGHVRGAFTGAVKDRQGLFEQADGGTLFLDEIADIGPGIQAQLLRVLQEKTFVPLGGTDPVHVDVRVLAATHKALRTEVEAGRFRADLMYRIRVVPLFLPPLRERPADIEALCWYFIDLLNERGPRRIDAIEERALEAMLAHDWPGNVRELHNVLQHAFAVGRGSILRLDELTPELRGEPPPTAHRTERTQERERILEALRETGGRKGEAAERLGISRSTLWRKMREHRL